MVKAITEEAAAARKKKRVRVLGAKAIKAADPHTRPDKVKRSPAPDFHAVLRDMRREYREFCDDYSRRSKAVRGHKHNTWKFPGGCYPPPPCYAPWELAPKPEVRDRGDPSPEHIPVIVPGDESHGAVIRLPDDAHPE